MRTRLVMSARLAGTIAPIGQFLLSLDSLLQNQRIQYQVEDFLPEPDVLFL